MRVHVKYYDGRVSELLGVYSAVVYQDDPDAGFHGPNRLCGEQSMFPSMSECLQPTKAEREDGEGVEVGLGRIGGVGERKEDGEKGKPERSIAFDFKFMCKGKDDYTPPDLLVQNHLAAYGEEFVIAQYREAQNWLLTNTHKLKTLGGTGKYLSGWLKRSKKYQDDEARKLAAQPVRVFQKADNLLSNANTQTEGW